MFIFAAWLSFFDRFESSSSIFFFFVLVFRRDSFIFVFVFLSRARSILVDKVDDEVDFTSGSAAATGRRLGAVAANDQAKAKRGNNFLVAILVVLEAAEEDLVWTRFLFLPFLLMFSPGWV